MIFEYQIAFLDRSSNQGLYPMGLCQIDSLRRPKSVALKSRVVILLFCLASFSQDPEFHCLMVIAAKVASVFTSPPALSVTEICNHFICS